MSMVPEIIVESRGSLAVLHIQGDLTVAAEAPINQAYADAGGSGAAGMVLNFAPDAYINSGGIAILLQLLAQARDHGQTLAISGLSKHFKKIFHMVGIDRFARLYDSVDEAAAGLEAP